MGRDWRGRLTGWRGRWRRAAFPALLALVVATSGAPASTVAAAMTGGIQPDTVQARQHECTSIFDSSGTEDPCVFLISMTPTQITIGLEPGSLQLILGGYEEYHVRWSARGGPEKSETVGPDVVNSTQTFTVSRRADDDAVFRFAVQRCLKVDIGKDECTGWTVRTYGGVSSGIETKPNPNAAGNGIETRPNPRAVLDNGIQTKPNPNTRR